MFYLPSNYTIRRNVEPFDDTVVAPEEWQKEVYDYAKKLADGSVSDVGCGSAGKLLARFKGRAVHGYDTPVTVAWLKAYRGGDGVWQILDLLGPSPNTGTVICADVLEHTPNPDLLLQWILRGNWKHCVLSTPDRSLLTSGLSGPPTNPSHALEWSFPEFARFVWAQADLAGVPVFTKTHMHTNVAQATQMIHLERP